MDSELSDGSSGATHDTSPRHSRLCRACLAALTSEALATNVLYAHHDSIQSLIQAKNRQCYVCTYIFALLPEEVWHSFRLLAEGTVPDHLLGRGSTPDTGRATAVGLGFSWSIKPDVSFTGLAINKVWGSKSEVISLQFSLMPKYKDGYLSHLAIPEDFIWKKWRDQLHMARQKLSVSHGPVIIHERGMHLSRLMT